MARFAPRALLGGLAILCVASAAVAAPTRASKSFDRGLSLYQSGRYDDAARAFFQAYRTSPHADALYNAGLAWELADQPASAATAYQLALELELRPDARADAERRLESLARQLGRIEMALPKGASVSVPPFSIKDSSAVFFLTPGRHRLRVTLPDETPIARSVSASAGETTVVLVEPGTDEAPERGSPERAPKRAGERAGSGDPADLRTLGFVSLGVSAVAVGTAVVLGLQTLAAKQDFDESGHRNGAARDRAERFMLWTNVAWATAAVTGVGGAVLLLTSDDGKTDAPAAGAVLQLHGRF